MSDSINFFVGLKLVALGQGAVTPMLRKMFRENSEKFYQNVQTKLKKKWRIFYSGASLDRGAVPLYFRGGRPGQA